MALSLASPGIKVREVDLTRGGVTATLPLSAGIAAPFLKGPVNEVVTVFNENDLVTIFGKPSSNNFHYESWYTASNFLAYGGNLKVVRCAGTNLRNSNAGVGIASTSVVINNFDEYQESTPTTYYWAAKDPGYWAEELKVCVIDNFADQTISGINTGTNLFNTVVDDAAGTIGITTTIITGINTTGIVEGHFVLPVTGIVGSATTVTGIGSSTVTLSTATLNSVQMTTTFDFGIYTLSGPDIQVGYGITQTLSGVVAGVGTTTEVSGYLKGIVTGVGNSSISVRVVSKVLDGVETDQEYTQNSVYEFKPTSFDVVDSTGSILNTVTPSTVRDWYNTQNILDVSKGDSITVAWRSVAPKPRTNAYVTERGGSNDAMHVVVVDSKKASNITGTSQSILEKFVNISKASDTKISPSRNIFYKDYIALNSRYIYAGTSVGDSADAYWNTTPVASKFTSGFTPQSTSDGGWAVPAEGISFNSIGNVSYTLTGGKDYSGTNNIGGLQATLANITDAYDYLADETSVPLNFLLQGSTSLGKDEEQAKANYMISIAESRKDCVAFISPSRELVVNVTPQSTQLSNILSFFSPLTSSSYAVFDSGYQYVYDRYNQQFVYIPCSGDVAGLCVRTDIEQFPWYSPAGSARGSFKYAIKLAYNPDQNARDQLYSQRINPVISSPGSGIILFGDKTALSYQSAFDRINVRRLFITIEQAIKGAANAQLFEFNDATTRANFINIVEPYLRDVQAKRGITDFLLVCDDTNNTPDVIDRNEFIADIYVKPARSINFIGLTFVATRTGVSFETIVGTV
jgi:hypothetical protein